MNRAIHLVLPLGVLFAASCAAPSARELSGSGVGGFEPHGTEPLAVCTGDVSSRRLGVTRACVKESAEGATFVLQENVDGASPRESVLPVSRDHASTEPSFHVTVDLARATGRLAELYPAHTRAEIHLRLRDFVAGDHHRPTHTLGDVAVRLEKDGRWAPAVRFDRLHLYGEAEVPAHWGYSENGNGPLDWGWLAPASEACFADEPDARQSPIAIVPAAATACDPAGGLGTVSYGPSRFSVVHNGHTVQANLVPDASLAAEARSFIVADGKQYDLLQFHIHTPSEHVVASDPEEAPHAYPLETHFVHRAQDGSLAVVGVLAELCETCAPDAVVSSLLDALPDSVNTPQDLRSPLDPATLFPEGPRNVFAYDGSLTTPPCSEGVSWYVMETAVKIAPAQLERIQSLLERHSHDTENARPVTPNNGRQLRHCTAGS